MERLHIVGIQAIAYLQENEVFGTKEMLLISEFGAPLTSYVLAFPLAYFINPKFGIMVAWATCISEWLNGVLKWVLHGHRPFWWVHENKHLIGGTRLLQFPVTCETGPGSPSGHCMITATSWYVVILCLSERQPKTVAFVLRLIFFIIINIIGISRCFIGAHFPHQVAGGIVTGILLALILVFLCQRLVDARPSVFVVVGLCIASSSVVVSSLLTLFGVDPEWSMHLAKKWCEKAAWIHPSTALPLVLLRDGAMLAGVGFSLFLLRCLRCSGKLKANPRSRIFAFFSALTTLLLQNVVVHSTAKTQSLTIYHCLAVAEFFAIPVVIMVMMPLFFSLLVKTDSPEVVGDKKKHEKSK